MDIDVEVTTSQVEISSFLIAAAIAAVVLAGFMLRTRFRRSDER